MDKSIIARISRGSSMNQIYLPKNKIGMAPGQYVVVNILTAPVQDEEKRAEKERFKPFFYGIKQVEPIKLEIIEKILLIASKYIKNEDNVIITGSFLESGFSFNDVDILILGGKKEHKNIEQEMITKIGIKPHIVALSAGEFVQGLASDPLYQTMISRCVSKNRLIFNYKSRINAKLLDLHLLKSKALIDNFEILSGKEKYYLTFNMISIMLFMQHGKISKDMVEKAIKSELGVKTLEEIKENMIGRRFLVKYKSIYNKTFDLVLKEMKHEQ